MKAFVEHLSGVIRVGPTCEKYGDPFDFAVAYSSVDGKTAIVKALVTSDGTSVPLPPDSKFSIAHARAIIAALKSIGLEADWERIK